MKISLIAAVSVNGVIGKENHIPWKLPLDMEHFKTLTTGHAIIMGRKTYESIGRPLPNRLNIVISRDKTNFRGCLSAPSLEKAIERAKIRIDDEIFVIGGSQIYELALPFADTIHLTRILAHIDGDTYFPLIDTWHWRTSSCEIHHTDANHAYPFEFEVLVKQ